MTELAAVVQAPRVRLSELGVDEWDIPSPARDHLERMLSRAHNTAPLTPVALSLMGPEAVVPSLLDVVRDGSLSLLERELERHFGEALRFSVSRRNIFYRSVGGGHVWGALDGISGMLTIFYSQHPFGQVPPFRNRREEGLVILT